MRTLPIKDLQGLIDACLWNLDVYLDTGKWTYEFSINNQTGADELVAKARSTAKRKIRCMGARYPTMAASINWQWIDYVLIATAWCFFLWLKDRNRADLQQQRGEIELLLIEQIGTEIKRLGFQLEM